MVAVGSGDLSSGPREIVEPVVPVVPPVAPSPTLRQRRGTAAVAAMAAMVAVVVWSPLPAAPVATLKEAALSVAQVGARSVPPQVPAGSGAGSGKSGTMH